MGRRRKKRHPSARGFWTTEHGGMPMWGIAASVALILGIGVFALAASSQQVQADYTRDPRPVPTFGTKPSASETPRAPLSIPGPGASAIVMGDSWTDGQSLDPTEGYVPILASAFGWEALNYGERGTGYVSNLAGTGTLYPDRVATLPAEAPGIVILQGGLNDVAAPIADVAAAAQLTLDELRAKYPQAAIVVVGPSTTAWPVADANTAVDATLAQTVGTRENVFYVSPLGGGWFNEANIGEVIGADSHPTAAGYQVYADQLAASLRSLAG